MYQGESVFEQFFQLQKTEAMSITKNSLGLHGKFKTSAIMNKSYWDTCELSVCFTTEVRIKHSYPFKNMLLFPSQYNAMLKFRKKYSTTFQQCVGGWRGQSGENVFVSGMCPKAPKVQICLETFVHNCSLHYLAVFDSCKSFFLALYFFSELQPVDSRIFFTCKELGFYYCDIILSFYYCNFLSSIQ